MGTNQIQHALKLQEFLMGSNAKSAGGSVVETIEAVSRYVSDHHINILPFHLYLASNKNRVAVSKPRRS